MKEPEVLVFLITGFLDSGKTSFLKFTLAQDYFQTDGLTLIILCEEGEEEYSRNVLHRHNTVIETVDSQEELTEEWLNEMQNKYHPERVIVEYNGMWKVSDFETMKLPKGWEITQKIATVDASTFSAYLQNLKPLFVEMVRGAELVLFNRCEDLAPLPGYRRNVKAVNPQAQIIFENSEGEIDNIFGESDVPYDVNEPIIRIVNEDYGIWYVDMMDNMSRYNGKKVEITARVLRPRGYPKDAFLAGRMAMTCCADDTTFLGYICKYEKARDWKPGTWVKVLAVVRYANLPAYEGIGPVLEIEQIEQAEEIKEIVYFN